VTDATTTDQPQSTLREERKVVTAVFADMVGSTALAERLDPEEVRLIVADAIARVVGTVENFGGTVKDLAGDGVLALFGAPVTHEDDAERAVRAALRIVQEIAAYGAEVARAWGTAELSMRVGVDTGPVVLGSIGAGTRIEYAAFGDTVNTAARLQAAANPGGVLVSDRTRSVVGSRFDWGEAQTLQLKGKSEPVVALEVLAPSVASARGRGASALQARFVGRERELALVRRAGDAVLSGSGGIVFITGDAGIGKSRLLTELHTYLQHGQAALGTAAWLEGRCVSYADAIPYWPFQDLVREWLGLTADEPELRVRISLRRRMERLFGERAQELYPYLVALLSLSQEPADAVRLGELSPEALQYRTFEIVAEWVSRLCADGPVALVLEDLHWADGTSLLLTERLITLAEEQALLLVITSRLERDHPSWPVKEAALREYPHRATEIVLEALAEQADVELLHSLVGNVLPADLERRILGDAEGNPFYLEELVRSLADAGALRRDGDGWRFDHEVPVEVPATVEKVILARIDRLTPACHDVLLSASVLGRHFGLPWLEGVVGDGAELRTALHELQRLDLVREGRRWPQPEYRFKHALIQEAAYRTILTGERVRLHRRAAEWLERRFAANTEEAYGLLARHWLACADEDKAVDYLARAGDKARLEYALDEAIGHYQALVPLLERHGRERDVALVLFKLALALHMSLRFAEANRAYQRAFEHWTRPRDFPGSPTATLRVASSFVPNDADPKSAIAWPNIQLCMQLFDRLVETWPERAIVPSLADRWEIADDGLRYVFYLRSGLAWSDGTPLTAHDVEFGIKRVLDPHSPGSSVAIYFVLENGQDYYLGRNNDAERIGVRAIDDHTVEFRLVAPAPYFMSVMNRPDGGPQPRHAIERDGAQWSDPAHQVVSGPFRQLERSGDHVVLVRQDGYRGTRPGNVGRIEMVRAGITGALDEYRRDELDIVAVRYTPLVADRIPPESPDVNLGAAAWTGYVTFDHTHPATSQLDLRRALAHAVDRDALAGTVPLNMALADGGVVPPALQGHTPGIAPRFDPVLARECLARVRLDGTLTIAGTEEWMPTIDVLVRGWHDVLGIDVETRPWTTADAVKLTRVWDVAPLAIKGWLPGYPDPEYYLRLLLHSESKTNEGGFANPAFDQLIEQARRDRSDRSRLALFHQADRLAVADQVALIPLVYGRSMAFVKPWVRGWWEFGKSSSAFADLVIDAVSPRA
jgi:ABC-type oligopeptide transport system substrate-binding subunit/class 3 adenylate cyclase